MMRFTPYLTTLAVASISACAGDSVPNTSTGPQIALSVAPLSLAGVTNARYQLVIRNGSSETVSDVTLTADQYGDGQGAITYVSPCDADDNDNSVSLTLLDLYEGAAGTSPIDPATYVNPGTLTQTVTCVENADVSVVFNLTIARDASQGFFDIAVAFDDVFCSAKFDCLRDPADPSSAIELLFNGAQRDRTFVMGFACTAGQNEAETWQYLNDVTITCGADAVRVDVGSAAGNLPASAIVQTAGSINPLFAAAVFQGEEELPGYAKQYWNVALGFNGGNSCQISARGTASPTALDAMTTPANTVWPVVTWDVALTAADGAQLCTQHPINDGTCPTSGVCVSYSDFATAETFDNAFLAGLVPDTGGGGAGGALTEADPGRWADGVATSCEDYIRPTDGHDPATADGVYAVDFDGAGATYNEINVYCDMTTDGGGWTKVESATHPFFFAAGDWDSLAEATPSADNYSILQYRAAFEDGGCYTYRLAVADVGNWQSPRDYYTVWNQCHDPFTAATNGTDYTYIAGEEPTTCGGFVGLHNTYIGNSYTSDVDSTDSSNCWYMQVVPNAQYPGSKYLDGYGGYYLQRQWQSLWLR